MIASTASESPEVTSTAPSTSKLFAVASRLSASRKGVTASAPSAIGMLMKKIHSQLSRSVKMPPSRTPAAAPKPPTAPQTPSAMFRSRPSRNVVIRIERAAGEITAAPRPCTARAPMSEASLQASPATSEPAAKRTRPAMNTRLRPSRSAARPPSSRKPPKTSAYALITHCRSSCENPRSILIEGSATFTIAMSRMTMNWTTLRRASAHHLRSDEAATESAFHE